MLETKIERSETPQKNCSDMNVEKNKLTVKDYQRLPVILFF